MRIRSFTSEYKSNVTFSCEKEKTLCFVIVEERDFGLVNSRVSNMGTSCYCTLLRVSAIQNNLLLRESTVNKIPVLKLKQANLVW